MQRHPVRRDVTHIDFLAVDWFERGLLLDSTVLYVGSWVDGNRDFSVQRLDAPGYTTVDLAATYELTAKLALFARVSNLLDKTYETPVGFLAPSIGAFAGVKVTF